MPKDPEKQRSAKLSPTEFKEKIMLCLSQGKIELSVHCERERMLERDVDIYDIRRALENGKVSRSPEWDDKHANWKYRINGKDIEGDSLTLIAIIFELELRLYIVTVF